MRSPAAATTPTSPPAATGQLGVFQRAMLRWNQLHPYNAVHVAELGGELDLPRLARAIEGTLERLGLGRVEIDNRAGSYRYVGGPARCELLSLPPDPDSHLAVSAELQRQLNRGFATGSVFCPFRFFVAPGERGFSLGLAYFHAVADASAILGLFRRILAVYEAGDVAVLTDPLEIYPARRDRGWDPAPGHLIRKLVALPSLLRQLRQSSRPHYRDPGDFTNEVVVLGLPPGSLRRLVESSHRLGVTVHDLFLALLMNAIAGESGAIRRRSPRRPRVAIGSIVNTRESADPAEPEVFGVSLGWFIITRRDPEGVRVADLARAVSLETRRIKARRSYLGYPLEVALGGAMFGLVSTNQRRRFYQKNCPLWGGVTNMNLNQNPRLPGGTNLRGYFRAVSTGPVTPLVLSVTSLGDVVRAVLSYRRTVFETEAIHRIVGLLADGIQSLEREA